MKSQRHEDAIVISGKFDNETGLLCDRPAEHKIVLVRLPFENFEKDKVKVCLLRCEPFAHSGNLPAVMKVNEAFALIEWLVHQ